jgi:hypothetical protein
VEYSRVKDILYQSTELMKIPDKWEESVPFRCSIGDEEYDSFLYWSTSGTQSEIKRMICVNSVSGKILTMEPQEMMESFKLKSLSFDANLIKDYNAYFDAKEKYEMFYSSFCIGGNSISNSLNAYELLVLLTSEKFIKNILSNVAGNFIEKICGRY